MEKKKNKVYIIVGVLFFVLIIVYIVLDMNNSIFSNPVPVKTPSEPIEQEPSEPVVQESIKQLYFYSDGTYGYESTNSIYRYDCSSNNCEVLTTKTKSDRKGNNLFYEYELRDEGFDIPYNEVNIIMNIGTKAVQVTTGQFEMISTDDEKYYLYFGNDDKDIATAYLYSVDDNELTTFKSNSTESFWWGLKQNSERLLVYTEYAYDGMIYNRRPVFEIFTKNGNKVFSELDGNLDDNITLFELNTEGFTIARNFGERATFIVYDNEGKILHTSKEYKMAFPYYNGVLIKDNNNDLKLVALDENTIKIIDNLTTDIFNIIDYKYKNKILTISSSISKNYVIDGTIYLENIDYTDSKIRKELYEDFVKKNAEFGYEDENTTYDTFLPKEGSTSVARGICGLGKEYEYNFKNNELTTKYIVYYDNCDR